MRSSTPPVAVFIFNRPDLTRQLLSALEKVRPEQLLVVADGPRNDAEKAICEETRAVFESVSWPCSIERHYSPTNLGCRMRVSSGLDWVFSRVESAVVLEDDCIPHPDFFPFCAQMLERYRDDERVVMVAGTNYLNQHNPADGADYFFTRYCAIWGWATWRRAWQQYDLKMEDWPRLKKAGQLRAFYDQDYMRAHFSNWFDEAHAQTIDTWDIQWNYSCLLQNGLSIVPRVNLVQNIGVQGTHGSGISSNHFRATFALDTTSLRHPRQMTPDLDYQDQFFKREFKPSVRQKLSGQFSSGLRKILPTPMRKLAAKLRSAPKA